MRTSLKKPKPKTPTILQDQSNKLKQKLQLLRQQVSQKKHQKQMNKTATSLQSASKPLNLNQTQNKLLSQTTKINMSKNPDTKLKNLLHENKLDTLEEKLKEKNVKTFDRFVELTEEEVDEWKDVAVGWRIKLKKLIKMCKQKKQTSHIHTASDSTTKQPAKQQTPSPSRQLSPPEQVAKQKNIEDIIRQRKQDQVFVPICRQIQQQPEEQQSELQMTEQDQDVIIQSFMKVFQPRKGIISKESRIGPSPKKSSSPSHQQDRKVSWSKKVEQMEREFLKKNHKKYPKQSIAKSMLAVSKQEKIRSSQVIQEPSSQSAIKYCWKCFRKINVKQNICFRTSEQPKSGVLKYFCCQKCEWLYEAELNEFESQLEDGAINDDSVQIKRQVGFQDEGDDIETIDLSIW